MDFQAFQVHLRYISGAFQDNSEEHYATKKRDFFFKKKNKVHMKNHRLRDYFAESGRFKLPQKSGPLN